MSREKILIVSDTISGPTGFANNGYNIAWCLAKEYEVHTLGLQSVSEHKFTTNVGGEKRDVTIHPNIPRSNQEWDFGFKSLPSLLKHLKPDVLLTINDIQMIQHIPGILYNPEIKLQAMDLPSRHLVSEDALLMQLQAEIAKMKEKYPLDCRWILYGPQDGEPPMPHWKSVYALADQVVAFCKWGQEIYHKYYNMNTPYIYHGVDTDLFTPKEKDVLKDKFTIGNFNRNQPRKHPVKTIKAFAKFAHGKNDVLLHMQMDWNDRFGWPLQYFTDLYGIRGKCIQPSQVGMPREKVAYVYNQWDINVNTCFHPDTQVITNPGTKQIKEINKGDKVLTGDGKFHKVKEKVCYKYKGNLLKIKPAYLDSFKVTPNHRIFRLTQNVFGNYLDKHKAKDNPQLEEIRADSLKIGDVMVFPRPKQRIKSKESIDLMRLYGLYLAEGCISQHKKRNQIDGIVFCVHTKEQDLTDFILKIMKQEFNLEGTIKDDTRNRRTIWFYSSKVGKQFKRMFSDNSHTKRMPGKFIKYTDEKLKSLIKGLWDGDGHIGQRKQRSTLYEYQTVSKQLAYQIWLILQKLGYLTSLHSQNRQSIVYRLRISGHQGFEKILNCDNGDFGGELSIGWKDNKYIYYPIIDIQEESYDGLVYDLNVEKIHNYCSVLMGHNTGGEGFGITEIEGMACAKPNIATDYTTTRELTIDGEPSPRGIAIPYEELYWEKMDVAAVQRASIDVAKLAESFEFYYKDRESLKKHGENARTWTVNNCSLQRIQNQWISTVKEVLNRSN